MSTLLLEGSVDEGDAVTIDLREGELDFQVESGGFDGMDIADWQPPETVDDPVPAGPSAPREGS